jgi:hypothetical protein
LRHCGAYTLMHYLCFAWASQLAEDHHGSFFPVIEGLDELDNYYKTQRASFARL